ncbi:hypothetical protein HHK36_005726 [Tetracentron sinense]|uniref:Uncharacterized protein n=1 Tax=Tetracentron sinense TaxID=13715 RepID=A0A835DMJ0_TETSI|nr:hypothetical protein HHK36_005726 [Tetracentron sinense]
MEEKTPFRLTVEAAIMLLMLWFMISPSLACTGDGNGCKDCILDQMKYGCSSCGPILRCMARCLWGGASQSKCVKRCDCDGGKPRLSDCKKCMAQCKCHCVK